MVPNIESKEFLERYYHWLGIHHRIHNILPPHPSPPEQVELKPVPLTLADIRRLAALKREEEEAWAKLVELWSVSAHQAKMK